MSNRQEQTKQEGNVRTRFLARVDQVVETMRQTTTVRRHPGREKAIRRIQGFMIGATITFGIYLIRGIVSIGPYQAREDAWAITFFDTRAQAWAIAFFAAMIYAGIVISIDRNEKEPWQMLLVCLLWGTVVSNPTAGILNTIWEKHIGPDLVMHGHILRVFSIAPFTEELTKGAVLWILWRASKEFDNALDGIVYGALVGIGFAMAENAHKFEEAFFRNESYLMYQLFLRLVLGGLASHATYTAITGLGLGFSRQTQRKWLKIVLPLLGLIVAILAHALWNNNTVDYMLCLNLIPPIIESGYWRRTVRAVLLMGPFLAGVIIAMVLSWRKENQVIAEQLAAEMNPDDPYIAPTTMLTVRERFRARRRTLRTRGIFAWWTLRQLQQTLIRLAFCKKWRGEDKCAIHALHQHIQALKRQLESDETPPD